MQDSEGVRRVRHSLEGRPVSPDAIVVGILRINPDYGVGRANDIAVSWPRGIAERPVGDWLSKVAALYRDRVFPLLHGRAVILGLGLIDLETGRRMVDAGLFHNLAIELSPPLEMCLTVDGKERLSSIPLAAAGRVTDPICLCHDAGVRALAFSPSGDLLATAGDDHIVRVWDWRRSHEKVSLPHPGAVRAVAFAPDGQRLATAAHDEHAARLWDLGGGEPTFLPHAARVLECYV